MKEIIDRILEGRFDYDSGSLSFSQSKIELTIAPDQVVEGSFRIDADPNHLTEGFVLSSDLRMECLTNHFSGSVNEIGFRFQGKGLEEGDVLKGNFIIISSQGEYLLPFAIMIVSPVLGSSAGDLKNLFQFANLAKNNWSEAVRLFYHPEFHRIFHDEDAVYLPLYRELSAVSANERNVEEFLIAIQKKSATQFIIDEDRIDLEVSEQITRGELLLTRNGWGYTYLEATTDEPFLTFERDRVTEEDFLGNRYTFYFYIDRAKLHSGLNYATITFKNSFTSMSIPVCVSFDTPLQRDLDGYIRSQELIEQLTEYYLQYRTKRLARESWREKTVEIIGMMESIDDTDPMPQLFKAQILMTEDKTNEAGWTLEHARAMIMGSSNEDPALWCYYLYLTTLLRSEEKYVAQITGEIREAYLENPTNWRLGWLLLFTSQELIQSPSKRWMFLSEQFDRGCNSPTILVEAWLLLKAEPSLFLNLSAFELHVLLFAARRRILTREVVNQLHYLITRSREKTEQIIYVLQAAYEMFEDSLSLQAICTLLIQEDIRTPMAFAWYARGVEENLRITRLYEYFMYSIDLDSYVPLPKVVFLYFSYNNTLDAERTAYLYENLLRQREEYPDLYEEYHYQIQSFVMDMLRKKKINRQLAYLYEQLIEPAMLDAEICRALSDLSFTRKVQVKDRDRYQTVLVRLPYYRHAQRIPLVKGEAYITVFGEDAVILLADAQGNLDVPGEQAQITPVIDTERILTELIPVDQTDLNLQIYACLCAKEPLSLTLESEQRFRKIAFSEEVEPSLRAEMMVRLLSLYAKHDMTQEVHETLNLISPEMFRAQQRAEVIGIMVQFERFETTREWIRTYGNMHVAPTILAALAGNLIRSYIPSEETTAEDPLLLELCFKAFLDNQFDQVTLQYLLDYYEGATRQMRDIWKKALDQHLSIGRMSERLLLQMLFTGYFVGEKMAIFGAYLNGQVSPNIEKAFLAQCSYDYFVKQKLTESVVFEDMERVYARGEHLQKICKLAFTRYYAHHPEEMDESRAGIMETFLRELLQENVVLPYFTVLAEKFPCMSRFEDKTIVEYRAHPDSRVMLHYMVEQRGSAEDDYHSVEMKDVFGGVYTTEFILFFGEKLLYYITEERNGRIEITESASISRNDMGNNNSASDRFRLLNDIIISQTLQDRETMKNLLEEYVRTDFLQQRLFGISKGTSVHASGSEQGKEKQSIYGRI
ncbi:MAG: DUF5717 family protein [Lachnospiraceae bacterium]|nr:DUF5717 family protein [Lachnospiraceae bacterium]